MAEDPENEMPDEIVDVALVVASHLFIVVRPTMDQLETKAFQTQVPSAPAAYISCQACSASR